LSEHYRYTFSIILKGVKMYKSTILASALLLAASGSAYAAQSVSIPVTVNVTSECDIQNFNGATVIDVSLSQRGQSVPGSVFVTCNDQLPYKLEADTSAAGEITVTDDNTGKSYPVKITQGVLPGGGAIFSTDANSGAIAGVGNGQSQMHQFQVAFNMDMSQGAQKVPQSGTYSGSLEVTVVY